MRNGREDRAAYITGVGVVSPIGVGRKAFWSSLLANESGVGPITLFDPEGFEVKIAAECTDFEPKDFMDRKAAQRTDRFAQLGLAAAKLALEDASAWGELKDNAERVGLILGSVIGGASEATIAPVIVAGFIAMRAMSRNNADPEGACRPYDKDHAGFVIGEGAATLILESVESVERRSAEPYARITGVGRTTDAYHAFDPDPKGRGILRAMQLALTEAGG